MFTIAYRSGQFQKAQVAKGDLSKAKVDGDVSLVVVTFEEDLRELPTPVMVALYNRANPSKPVSKFENKRVAARRLFPLVEGLSRGAQIDLGESKDRSDVPEGAPEKGVSKKGKKGRTKKPAKSTKEGRSPARGRRLGIGVRMAELIREEKETQEILETIHKEFPESRAQRSDVSIIRSRVRRGEI